jgi:hypothetical protein
MNKNWRNQKDSENYCNFSYFGETNSNSRWSSILRKPGLFSARSLRTNPGACSSRQWCSTPCISIQIMMLGWCSFYVMAKAQSYLECITSGLCVRWRREYSGCLQDGEADVGEEYDTNWDHTVSVRDTYSVSPSSSRMTTNYSSQVNSVGLINDFTACFDFLNTWQKSVQLTRI